MFFSLSGCLSRRTVVPAELRPFPAQVLTRAELVQYLEAGSSGVETLTSPVTLDVSGGAMTTGVLTEYRQTNGVLLVERPRMIRIRAMAPVVRTTVFDMVSDGEEYRVSIPPRNKFLVGDAHSMGKAENPVLNLRPQHIMSALFVDIRPYLSDPDVISFLEETTSGRHSYYVLGFVNVAGQNARLLEKIWFDRTDLHVTRKQIFAGEGEVDTDVEYSNYQMIGETSFPLLIAIQRPVEDYSLTMTLERTQLNQDLAADSFRLDQPSGAEFVRVDTRNRNLKQN